MLTKEQLRNEIKKKRLLLTASERQKRSQQIVDRLKKLLPPKVSFVLLYAPHKGEVDVLPLAKFLLSRKITVGFPRVERKEIVPLAVESIEELSPGYFGILEPPFNPLKLMKTIDFALIPGLAFDLNCFRLGYGGGFYDRFLAKWDIRTKIGICFDFQLIDSIPVEPFDHPVDMVVTEKRVVRRKEWS